MTWSDANRRQMKMVALGFVRAIAIQSPPTRHPNQQKSGHHIDSGIPNSPYLLRKEIFVKQHSISNLMYIHNRMLLNLNTLDPSFSHRWEYIGQGLDGSFFKKKRNGWPS